jgi:hypothetical protein
MEKPVNEKAGDAVLGRENHSVSTTKKFAAPLSDQEWRDLMHLRETANQNEKDHVLGDLRPGELTHDQLRLNELDERLFATIPECSAHAAQYAFLWHERLDLERRLYSLDRELVEAEAQVRRLQDEYNRLQRELTVCEVVREHMLPAKSAEEQQVSLDAATRLGRLIKSAVEFERRIPVEGPNAND